VFLKCFKTNHVQICYVVQSLLRIFYLKTAVNQRHLWFQTSHFLSSQTFYNVQSVSKDAYLKSPLSDHGLCNISNQLFTVW